jgi:hypothetical protein
MVDESVGRSHLWIRGGTASSSDDPFSVGNELPALEQESFQDRIDAWKKYQQVRILAGVIYIYMCVCCGL